MNRGGSKNIYKREIGLNVDMAKVWEKRALKKGLTFHDCYSRDVYFIRNEKNKYIGAVYDMGHDLHWYIQKSYRKKGYLTKAMNDIILPFLFNYKSLSTLNITINKNDISSESYEASVRVAKSLGFKSENSLNYILADVDIYNDSVVEKNIDITSQRENEIKEDMLFMYKKTQMLADEVEMHYGCEKEVHMLREIASNLNNWFYRLEDIMLRNKKEDSN
jgi:hypothetical protein